LDKSDDETRILKARRPGSETLPMVVVGFMASCSLPGLLMISKAMGS
jgi:hypothetical protein